MKLIDKFERSINKTVKDLTIDEITKLVNDESYSEYFREPENFLELVTEIINRNPNKDLINNLRTAKYEVLLGVTENKILNIFKQYREDEIERDELLSKMTEMTNDKDPVVSMSAMICVLVSLKDLKIDRDQLVKNFNDIRPILDNFGNEAFSYQTESDILDLIYQLNNAYFVETNDDVIASIDTYSEWLDEKLLKMHELEDKILNLQIPKANVNPEDLGLIDITKLKGKE